MFIITIQRLVVVVSTQSLKILLRFKLRPHDKTNGAHSLPPSIYLSLSNGLFCQRPRNYLSCGSCLLTYTYLCLPTYINIPTYVLIPTYVNLPSSICLPLPVPKYHYIIAANPGAVIGLLLLVDTKLTINIFGQFL